MAAWKVLFIAVFGVLCLVLVMGTIVVPLALTAEENRWLWFAGFLVSSIVMTTLFTLFLRNADRTYRVGR